jgi:hypothetical protein
VNRTKERAAISWFARGEDGPFFGYDAAKIDCPRCEEAGGWDGENSGLCCPFGCGVRLLSTQEAEDERFRAEEKARAQIRRDERAARRAERARRSR